MVHGGGSACADGSLWRAVHVLMVHGGRQCMCWWFMVAGSACAGSPQAQRSVGCHQENKYRLQGFARPWISDAIMVSLNRKHELFRQYKNGIVTFDHYNSFKNNFTTTLRHARNNYFQRKFTECSNNSRDTWKTLNSLIRYKNNS